MFVATKVCLFLSPQNLDFRRGKSGINICVTSTRFSCCYDMLVKGWSYMKMAEERNIFLSKVQAEIATTAGLKVKMT